VLKHISFSAQSALSRSLRLMSLSLSWQLAQGRLSLGAVQSVSDA